MELAVAILYWNTIQAFTWSNPRISWRYPSGSIIL